MITCPTCKGKYESENYYHACPPIKNPEYQPPMLPNKDFNPTLPESDTNRRFLPNELHNPKVKEWLERPNKVDETLPLKDEVIYHYTEGKNPTEVMVRKRKT